MKITVEYSQNSSTPELNIKDVKYIGDFVMRIYFNSNENKLVDFKPFLMKASHPAIKKYTNENLFKQYKIVNGNLNWNDYDLIFPISDLYESKIIA
jgi:hypothetical protein